MISFFHDPCCLNFMKQFYKYFAIFIFWKAEFCFAKLKVENDTHAKIVLSQAYGNYCPKFSTSMLYYEYIQREYTAFKKKSVAGDHHSVNRFGETAFPLEGFERIFMLLTSLLHFYWGGNGVTYTLWGPSLLAPRPVQALTRVWLVYIPDVNLPLPLCH